jgi:two-component system OmpR family response regulator
MRILLVEDDAELAAGLLHELKAEGFAADHADNGVDGEYLGDEEAYDAAILDLGLPGRPGLEVLANWRRRGNRIPVIVLTARGAWHERVDGLRAGADDYLGKPFHVEELMARVHALIRREAGRPMPSLSADGIALDQDTQELIREDGTRTALTGTEFRLLRYFMLHPGQVLSKTRLTEHIYDQDFDRDSNLIEVYVRRLREKIGAERIETRRGQGYVLRLEASAAAPKARR